MESNVEKFRREYAIALARAVAKDAAKAPGQNRLGLTFDYWLANAGGKAHVDALIREAQARGHLKGFTARKAWLDGEDPTDYRAATPTKNMADGHGDLKMYDVVFKKPDGTIGKWQRFAPSISSAKKSAESVIAWDFGGKGKLVSVRLAAKENRSTANRATKATTLTEYKARVRRALSSTRFRYTSTGAVKLIIAYSDDIRRAYDRGQAAVDTAREISGDHYEETHS